MDGAIVLGADYRGLGVVRSLGRKGVRVWVLTEAEERLAGSSRYAERALRRPPDGLVPCLLGLPGVDGWALFPTSDEDAALLGRHHAALSRRFVVTSPPWEVVRWGYDKRLMHALADELGIAAPRTAFGGAEDEIGFPAVLKPAVKVGFNKLTAAKAWRVDSREELRACVAEASELVDSAVLMVQELIPGGGETQLSYAALACDGEPLAALTARRTRQYPADFGRASTYVETAHVPDIVEPATRFLRRIRFTGLVELEFKRDPRDGVPKLLDVNPRVWGWHTLGAAAGMDFPWLMWLSASGREVPRIDARVGVRWLRLSTDLPMAVREIVHRRLSAASYVRTLLPPKESAIAARDDPVPGLLELPLLAGVLVRRLARGNGV
jgi:predicted ATP-grasp superfamily ATP-dependent carboligase